MANNAPITGAPARAPDSTVNAASTADECHRLALETQDQLFKVQALSAGIDALIEKAGPIDITSGPHIGHVDVLRSLIDEHITSPLDGLEAIETAALAGRNAAREAR